MADRRTRAGQGRRLVGAPYSTCIGRCFMRPCCAGKGEPWVWGPALSLSCAVLDPSFLLWLLPRDLGGLWGQRDGEAAGMGSGRLDSAGCPQPSGE